MNAIDTMEEYRLHIDAFTPETMPMSRLVEYLRDLSNLLGENSKVHLVKIEDGSLNAVAVIDADAIPKVELRIDSARRGEGVPEAIRAVRGINFKLQEDNGTGSLRRGVAEVIRFPGRELLQGATFKIVQEDSLDGIVIKVGGKNDPVPVQIESEDGIYNCSASRDTAKELAPHIFVTQLRVEGEARWFRDNQGKWRLERLFIRQFKPLDTEPLSAIVAKLRAVKGGEWGKIANPWAELEELRHGTNGG